MYCSGCGGLLLSVDPGPKCAHCQSLDARILAGEPDPRASRGQLRKLYDALVVASRVHSGSSSERFSGPRVGCPVILVWAVVLMALGFADVYSSDSSDDLAFESAEAEAVSPPPERALSAEPREDGRPVDPAAVLEASAVDSPPPADPNSWELWGHRLVLAHRGALRHCVEQDLLRSPDAPKRYWMSFMPRREGASRLSFALQLRPEPSKDFSRCVHRELARGVAEAKPYPGRSEPRSITTTIAFPNAVPASRADSALMRE